MRWMILCLGSLALACSDESVESEDIRTTGIYPEIQVTATGNGSSLVRVRLKVGGSDSNTYLNLTGDDTLSASADVNSWSPRSFIRARSCRTVGPNAPPSSR